MLEHDLLIPPHSIEAEQSVIGALLTDSKAFNKISDFLHPEHFYRRDHAMIYAACCDLELKGLPLDAVSLSEKLLRDDLLEQAGGLSYLATIAKNVPSTSNVAAYAKIVFNHATNRKIIEVADALRSQAFRASSEDSSVEALLNQGLSTLFEIEQSRARTEKGLSPLKPLLKQQLERLETLASQGEQDSILGVSTGLYDLDQRYNGLQAGKLYVVAGRPSMGKTTLALNWVTEVAKQGKSCAVFSMEMTNEELTQKFLASAGSLDLSRLNKPWTMEESDWAHVAQGIKGLREASIALDDTSALSPAMIRSRIRRFLHDAKADLGLVVIDYLQLMHGDKASYPNRESEISEISRTMKQLAKEFNVPIVLISQLNRSLESRPNKRPLMSDLRESGAIEQDADVILMVYREEVYSPENSECHGKAELITRKCRGGVSGTDAVQWQGNYQRFKSFDSGYEDYPESQQSVNSMEDASW